MVSRFFRLFKFDLARAKPCSRQNSRRRYIQNGKSSKLMPTKNALASVGTRARPIEKMRSRQDGQIKNRQIVKIKMRSRQNKNAISSKVNPHQSLQQI